MGDSLTFEEAREEANKKREEEGKEPIFAGEVPGDIDREDLEELTEELETFLEVSPDELTDTIREESSRERTRRLRDIVVNVDNSDIISDFEDAESQLDFLQNIAQSNISIMQTLSVLGDIQVQMLESVFSIESFLSPFSAITVSGTNDIENADTAEPVVPESETTDILTRTLFIKASENNDKPIAIGDDGTEPSNGWILHPNEHLILDMNLVNVTLYMASEEAGETVELLGVV